MAYYDRKNFDCLEALRKELFDNNPDIVVRLTPGVPMLHTLGEICALIGIPVDLVLSHEQLVAFIWDMAEILRRRGTIMIAGGAEVITDTITAVQEDLLSDVLQEYATGIIVTQDEIIPVAEEQMQAAEALKESGRKLLH